MAATVEMFGRFNETRDFQENSLEPFEEGQGDFQQASMNIPIPENNIGHQLLVRQGWQAGQGLGKKLQGRVDPIPIVLKEEQLGFGRMEMELGTAEETTEKRRLLECEKENTQELREKYKENQEREKAKEESLADLKSSFFCDLCSKQYIKHTDFDNHINSYDHAHKQRLKELKQKEVGRQLGAKRYKEDKKQEKEMKRIHEFAESRVESQSNEGENLDDICLPRVDSDAESNAVTMVDNLTIHYDKESPFVPPLPDEPPEGKALVSFSFSKRTSSKITATAGVFDNVPDNSKAKDINTKPDSDTSIGNTNPVENTDEREIAEDSRGEFYHSSPPPHCKVKPQFQFLVFVKSDLKWDVSRSDGEKNSADTGVPSNKAMVADEGDSPCNPANGANVKGSDCPNKNKGNLADTITDAKDISDNADLHDFAKNPNERMLRFVKVVCASGNNELDWPCEMVQLTTTDPTLCYSCNPLSFDFTQLSSKSKPKDKFIDQQGGVLVGDPAGDKTKTGDSTSAKKDKSKKKKRKRKKYRHKIHDSDKIGNEECRKKSRKKKKHRRKSSDKENEVATGTGVKATDPKISKSKKHKKRRKSSKRRHKAADDTGGESGDNGKDDKQTTMAKPESKTEALDDKSKQKHKKKKKRSKKRKKSKRSRHSDSGSEAEEEKDTPPDKEGEKKKEKVLKKKRQRKSGDENMSDSESEACDVETKSSQKSKPTRKYRKHKIPRLARDSSQSDTGRTTSIKPVVNEKAKNNQTETDVLKTGIPKSDKIPNTLENAEKEGSSSHRSTGSRKKLLGTQTKAEDALICKVVKSEQHPDDALENAVLKPETVKADGILEKGLLKSEPGKTEDDFDGAGFEDLPHDAGKSKWDTSSDSEFETIIKMKTEKKTPLDQTLKPKLNLKCSANSESSKNPGSVKDDAPKAAVDTESHRTSNGSGKESDSALRPRDRGSEEREKSKNRHSDSDSADDRFSRSRSRSRSRRSRSFSSDSYDDRRSSRHSKRSYSSESDSRSRSSYRMKRSRSDSRSRKGYRSSRRHSSYTSYSDEDYHRSRSRSFSRSRRRDRSISRSRSSRHRRRSYSRSSSSRSRSRSYSRSRSRSRSRTYRRSRSYDRGYRRQMKQSPDKQFSSVIPKRQKPSRQCINKEKKVFEPNQLVAPIPYTTPKHGVSVEAQQLLNKVKGKGDGVDAKHGYANASIPSATDKGPVFPLIGKLPAGKKGGVDEKEGKGLDDVSQIPTPDELSIPLPPLGNCNQTISANSENKFDKQFIGPTLPNHHQLSQMQDIPLPTEPKKVNPQDRFQHIGPNDPLVFTSRIPPPPPVNDIEAIPGMPAPPPPPPFHCVIEQGTNSAPPLPPPQADAPPLPGVESHEILDEMMENAEPESTDPMSMTPIIIPPEQVEQYKALQAQAQLHAQHRQRVEAGLPDSDEEPEIDEIGEPQPITLIPARHIHPSFLNPQPQVIQHLMRSPQQIPFHTSLGHIPMLQPPGLHAVPHTAATLQIPQAGAPMVLAAPSHTGQLAAILAGGASQAGLPAGMTFAGHPHALHHAQHAFHLPLSMAGLQPQSAVLQASTPGLAGLHHSALPQHLLHPQLGGILAARMPSAGPLMISPTGAVLVPRLPGHIQLQ